MLPKLGILALLIYKAQQSVDDIKLSVLEKTRGNYLGSAVSSESCNDISSRLSLPLPCSAFAQALLLKPHESHRIRGCCLILKILILIKLNGTKRIARVGS